MVNSRYNGLISRLHRGVRSIPVADLLMAILILATILTVPTLAGGNFILKFILVVMVIVLIVKTAVEYRIKKYDYELVFIFDAAFEKLIPQRKEAANVCKKYLNMKSLEKEKLKNGAK